MLQKKLSKKCFPIPRMAASSKFSYFLTFFPSFFSITKLLPNLFRKPPGPCKGWKKGKGLMALVAKQTSQVK